MLEAEAFAEVLFPVLGSALTLRAPRVQAVVGNVAELHSEVLRERLSPILYPVPVLP